MGKKDETELTRLVQELVDDVNVDRERLVQFTDELIAEYGGDRAAGIAEYVSKLTDAMTRQHQVKVATIKAVAKQLDVEAEDDEDEDYSHEIGPAFDGDRDEGSN